MGDAEWRQWRNDPQSSSSSRSCAEHLAVARTRPTEPLIVSLCSAGFLSSKHTELSGRGVEIPTCAQGTKGHLLVHNLPCPQQHLLVSPVFLSVRRFPLTFRVKDGSLRIAHLQFLEKCRVRGSHHSFTSEDFATHTRIVDHTKEYRNTL